MALVCSDRVRYRRGVGRRASRVVMWLAWFAALLLLMGGVAAVGECWRHFRGEAVAAGKSPVPVVVLAGHGLATPAAVYVLYFLGLGKSRKQARRVLVAAGLLTVPVVGYVCSADYVLSRGLLDMEVVIGVVFLVGCMGMVWLAVVQRWQELRAPRESDYDLLCVGCGYDLKGNVSGHCPECGLRLVGDDGEGE